MIGRVVAISLAVVACAWFALATQQAREVSRATAIAEGPGSLRARQAEQADSLLASASTLNPDRQIDLLRGLVALDRSQRARAIEIFQRLTRAEPLNVNAWVDLARAGLGDSAMVDRAVVNIARLDRTPRAGR